MRYLKSYNESEDLTTTYIKNKKMLEDMLKLELEDSKFEANWIIVTSAIDTSTTWQFGKVTQDNIFEITLSESWCNNDTAYTLVENDPRNLYTDEGRLKVKDMGLVDMTNSELGRLIIDTNTKIVNKLAKKYDLTLVETPRISSWYIDLSGDFADSVEHQGESVIKFNVKFVYEIPKEI